MKFYEKKNVHLIEKNHFDFFFQVEDQGVDPNLRDGDGATPLHFAASRGHLTCVRWLLSHGAKLSLDKYGKSPINDAAENQQVEVDTNPIAFHPRKIQEYCLTLCLFAVFECSSSTRHIG